MVSASSGISRTRLAIAAIISAQAILHTDMAGAY
jgi:hypothetical protein